MLGCEVMRRMPGFLLLFFLTLMILEGKIIRSPEQMSLREMGMGGAFTAVADDYYLLFSNPAGLALENKFFTGSTNTRAGIGQIPLLNARVSFPGGMFEPIQDIQNNLISGPTSLSTALRLFNLIDRVPFGADVRDLVLPFGYIGNKWAFQFTYGADFLATALGGLLPSHTADAGFHAQLKFGFAPFSWTLLSPGDLTVGFSVKALALLKFEGTLDLGTAAGFFGTDGSLNTGEIISYAQKNGVAGAGVDLGALFRLGENWVFGVSVIDLFSPFVGTQVSTNGMVSGKAELLFPNLRLGANYELKLNTWWKNKPKFFLNKIILAADLKNLFDPDYTFFKCTHFGLTFNLLDARFLGLNLSLGLNELHATWSATLKLLVFQISYAYFQRERGNFIGGKTDERHVVELVTRF